MGQEVAVAIEKEAMVTFGLRFSFAMALCVHCEETLVTRVHQLHFCPS